MFTAKIGTPTKEILQADESEFMNVPVEIIDAESGDVVAIRNIAHSLTATPEEITAEVKRIVTTYNSDYNHQLSIAEHDAMHATADETIKELTGLEVEPEATAEVEAPETPEA